MTTKRCALEHEERIPMFEKDPDQSNTPEGLVAYIVRNWGQVIKGVVSKVGVKNNLPLMNFVYHPLIESSSRPATFPSEVSRVFLRDNVEIDPGVFNIAAEPVPETIKGHLRG